MEYTRATELAERIDTLEAESAAHRAMIKERNLLISQLNENLDRCNAHLGSCQDIGNHAGMVNEELKAENAALRDDLQREIRAGMKNEKSRQQEHIAELELIVAQEAELAALREVATAVDGVGMVDTKLGNWQPLWDAMAKARAAGYLEEARP